jgi:hypothetical protein
MSSGKGKTQTTTQTSAPPAYIEDQLKYGTEEARRLYNQPAPKFFGGQTYAGFTPQQEQALNLTEQRALAGSPLTREAQAQLGRTLRGEFLGANQYLDPMVEAATRGARQRFAETTMPSVQSSLGRAGRYGNNAATQQLFTNAQRTLAQQLTDTEANIRGQNYAQERNFMNAAIGQAPALAAQDYADTARLAAVGEQRQAMNQAGINEAMQRYQYENNIDQEQLNQFLARITGISPQAGKVQTEVKPVAGANRLGQVLGVGMAAAGAFTGNPMLIAGGVNQFAGASQGGSGGGASPFSSQMFGSMPNSQPTPFYPQYNPMGTIAGGAYGGGYSNTAGGGRIDWYK